MSPENTEGKLEFSSGLLSTASFHIQMILKLRLEDLALSEFDIDDESSWVTAANKNPITLFLVPKRTKNSTFVCLHF